MNRKKSVIILIIVIVILAIAAFIIALWWKKPTNVNVTNQSVNQTANANLVNVTTDLNTNLVVNSETKEKASLATIAQSFAERFGSYSNQNNFANILNLQDLMSDKLKAWSDKYMAEERAKNLDTTTYHGVTTKSISYQTIDFQADKSAEFLINTQRVESTDTPTNVANTYYQEITIKLIKEKGNWKVDEAKWKEVKS